MTWTGNLMYYLECRRFYAKDSWQYRDYTAQARRCASNIIGCACIGPI